MLAVGEGDGIQDTDFQWRRFFSVMLKLASLSLERS